MLFLLAALFTEGRAQSNQELLEAYRNGTLSQSQIDDLKAKNSKKSQEVNRARSVNGTEADREELEMQDLNGDEQGKYGKRSKNAKDTNDVRPPVEKAKILTNMPEDPQKGLTRDKGARDSLAPANFEQAPEREIFGHDLFTNDRLTFEPNMSIATPDNYVLGAGDEVIVDLWGNTQTTIAETVSPDGKIVISDVGPVTLAGLTVAEAAQRLRGSLAEIYEGLYDGTVRLKVSLGKIRSIQVNVAGEVGVAGTYTLPSLATLFHALHVAGGVDRLGTLRSIKIYRGGKLFSDVDVYDYILNGKADKDIALRDGDLVTISPYGKLVEITGQIKRPMFYEMKGAETVADLVRFAGDFTSDANRAMVSVTRRQGGEYRSFTVGSGDFGTFVLEDGDMVSVGGAIERYENRVQVKGAVYREGYYAIDDRTNTVKQLVERADGLRADAFLGRALLYREKPDWTMEVKAVDLDALMSGRVADIELRPNDMLVVASVAQMQESFDVTIFGSVSRPDTYPYAENMTVEDLIVTAGGLLESASTANVIVTRRIKDPKSNQVSETLVETFTLDINEDLAADGEGGFVLEPFDQVYVRRSPVYVTQSSATVRGEVAFEGTYPLSHRNMRISELIAAAGNATPGAFVEGAYLLRKMTDEERTQNEALRKMIEQQAQRGDKDSLNMAGVELESVYPVGIDLARALAEPGSDADVVLRDGDVVSVPMYNGTVRVMGAVLYPNSVTYQKGRKLDYYVKSAGGYDNNARKNRSFVVYMNGMVASGKSAEIRPGCIVIVPSKSPTEPIKWSEVVGLVSSTASTAAVVISVLNLTK